MNAVEEARAFLDKADKSFNAADTLLQAGHAEFAVSRVYYGCFYIAEAPLLTEHLSFSQHGTVIAEYGRLFAKTERLDRRFHRLLQSTFTARHTADYDANADLNAAESDRGSKRAEPFSTRQGTISTKRTRKTR